MKYLLAITILLASLSMNAQTFLYHTKCTGMQIDTMQRMVHNSRCMALNGKINIFKTEMFIDKLIYYIYSSDTIQDKVYFYVDDRNNVEEDKAACIIYDPKKGVFTVLSGDFTRSDILNMTFYLFKK